MPRASSRGCPVCGSPDRACGEAHIDDKLIIGLPTESKPTFTGPMVEAFKPGPAGSYLVRMREDEAAFYGYQLAQPVDVEPEVKARPPAKNKARTAPNK